MTVTKDQAQMLATLAVACRPHRAATWDAAGVVAAIGKVKDRALVEVALAVLRAAADRDAKTPGVIPTAGSHWQEQLKPEPWRPDQTPREERCGICAKPRERCQGQRVAGDDHNWEPDVKRQSSTDVAATVHALRELVVDAKAEPTTPTPRAEIRGRHESEGAA